MTTGASGQEQSTASLHQNSTLQAADYHALHSWRHDPAASPDCRLSPLRQVNLQNQWAPGCCVPDMVHICTPANHNQVPHVCFRRHLPSGQYKEETHGRFEQKKVVPQYRARMPVVNLSEAQTDLRSCHVCMRYQAGYELGVLSAPIAASEPAYRRRFISAALG